MEENNKNTQEQEDTVEAQESKQNSNHSSSDSSKKNNSRGQKKSVIKKKSGSDQKLRKELDEVSMELENIKDKYVRLSAEFDNYRKRTLKEKMDLTKTGGEKVLINILPVLDNFERALAAIKEARDMEAVKVGIELIVNKFKEFLAQNGVTEIEAMQEEFNTDLHEAITKIPTDQDEMRGKVVDVIEKGYFLHDKVIRYAKVVIGE